MKKVYVCGSGLLNSAGFNETLFTESLTNSQTGIKKIQNFDTSMLDYHLSGEISRDELLVHLQNNTETGPFFKQTSELSDLYKNKSISFEAMILIKTIFDSVQSNPKLSLQSISGSPLYIGSTKSEISALEKFAKTGKYEPFKEYIFYPFEKVLKMFLPVSEIYSINNACASSLIGIINGTMAIQSGICETALCTGIDLITEFTFSGFAALKALSDKLTKPFDKNRDGLNPGTAAGTVILTSDIELAGAYRKQLYTISGSGISNDAYHITHPDPDGTGLYTAVKHALETSGLTSENIDYINAHGTGTVFNEIMENSALSKIFGKNVPVSSTKAATGHTMGASGVTEVISIINMMENNTIIPTINTENPDPAFSINILKEQKSRELKNVLKCNSGFGGVNAALVLSRE